MVDNKSEDSSCVACQTPRPGAKPGESTGFNVGGGQTFSSSPFKFGMGNSAAASSSSVSAFKLGPSSSVDSKTNGQSSPSVSITFGDNADQNRKNDTKSEGTTQLPTFVFGSSTILSNFSSETKTGAPTFTFGAPVNNQSGKDDSSKPSFSFGGNSSVDKDKATSRGEYTFGTKKVPPDASNKGNHDSCC